MKSVSLARALVGALLILPALADAGVTFTPLGADRYRVDLEPLTFRVLANANDAGRVIIEDFFATDSTDTSSEHISGEMAFSLNGGATQNFEFITNNGAFAGKAGAVDSNDLLFNFRLAYQATGPGAVQAGDLITVSTLSMIFENDTVGLAQRSGPYTAYLLENTQIIGEALVGAPVPAPTGVPALLLAPLALAALRARPRRAIPS